MASVALMRACGVLITGAAGYEWIRSTQHTQHTPTHTLVVHPQHTFAKYIPYVVASGGLLYFGLRTPYVTTRQFKTTCDALQTQIASVTNTLHNVKKIVLARFTRVDTRLDDIERTVLAKTAELKRDLAHLETLVARLGGQITLIQSQTNTSSAGVKLLCGVVASSLDNTLTDKLATAKRLHNINTQA